MKRKSTVLLLLSVLLNSSGAQAIEKSGPGTVDRLVSYSSVGNGDVFISLSTNGATCNYGYFVNKNSQGFEGQLSMLLAAYQAKTPVYISANENSRWSNSSNTVCEVHSIEYKR